MLALYLKESTHVATQMTEVKTPHHQPVGGFSTKALNAAWPSRMVNLEVSVLSCVSWGSHCSGRLLWSSLKLHHPLGYVMFIPVICFYLLFCFVLIFFLSYILLVLWIKFNLWISFNRDEKRDRLSFLHFPTPEQYFSTPLEVGLLVSGSYSALLTYSLSNPSRFHKHRPLSFLMLGCEVSFLVWIACACLLLC